MKSRLSKFPVRSILLFWLFLNHLTRIFIIIVKHETSTFVRPSLKRLGTTTIHIVRSPLNTCRSMHLPTLHRPATIQVPDDAVKNDQEVPAEKTVLSRLGCSIILNNPLPRLPLPPWHLSDSPESTHRVLLPYFRPFLGARRAFLRRAKINDDESKCVTKCH